MYVVTVRANLQVPARERQACHLRNLRSQNNCDPAIRGEDIDALEENLEEAQQKHTRSAEELGYQLEIVRTVKPFWKYVTPAMLQGATASGAALISQWRDESELWKIRSEEELYEITVASGTATSLASNTAPMEFVHLSKPVVDMQALHRITAQKDERTFVQAELATIDTGLANTYLTVWQYMNLPVFDPLREPLFLMRQVFDHFLDKLAPDSDVISQTDFVPDEKLKEKNGKGVTRRHRIEFVAKAKIKDKGSRRLVLQSTQNFLDVYDELNRAHDRAQLDENKAKDAVYAGSALLAAWLRALHPA